MKIDYFDKIFIFSVRLLYFMMRIIKIKKKIFFGFLSIIGLAINLSDFRQLMLFGEF
jgi:hypothetical protein